jgi:hypothetical protein
MSHRSINARHGLFAGPACMMPQRKAAETEGPRSLAVPAVKPYAAAIRGSMRVIRRGDIAPLLTFFLSHA